MEKTVLLVDDKREFRNLMKIYLSRKYKIETAENGLHALTVLQNGLFPDLIVCDLMMPEVDGLSFVKQLKASGAFKHIPVIILSSIDTSSTKIELLKFGASDYMIKPVNPAELEIRIENLLRK